jgi:phosphotriesterase-related protein
MEGRHLTLPDLARGAAASLSRREWLSGTLTLLAGGCAARGPAGVETAIGPVGTNSLGVTLVHEHILVDFIGAAAVSPSRYDSDEVFTTVLPHLQAAHRLGLRTLVECTPAYLGRDAALLRRLSRASNLNILSNTGYYGAAQDKHLPAHAFVEDAEQLAARWIEEAKRGIDGTGVKPAFMKIGVDGTPLSAVDRKLVIAAALAHRATGLPIASHTSSGSAAIEQLEMLEHARVPASAFIWVHAHSERDDALHVRAAARGAWVEFDGVSESTVPRHVELVSGMKTRGLLGRVLVSQDAGWYRVGEAGGGRFRPYTTIFTAFIPALKNAGFTDAEVQQLFVANPRAALTGRPLSRG